MNIRKAFNTRSVLFIPFIMAGHPNLETSLAALITLAEVGADLIELGVPFSDPVADGPINQKAAHLALQQGTSLQDCLNLVQTFREHGYQTPVILFSYLNPLLAMGLIDFVKAAKKAEVSGVLVVDLPPEESLLYHTINQQKLEMILLVSSTTSPERIALIRSLKPGFVYAIARLGITGVQKNLEHDLESQVKSVKKQVAPYPVAVGFGISSIDHAKTIAQYADGVIVGSLLVQTLEQKGLEAFKQLATELAEAIHILKKNHAPVE